MNKGGHFRYFSQHSPSQSKEYITISPKTLVLQQNFQPTLTLFQQKYLKLIENSPSEQKQIQKKKKEKYLNEEDSKQCQNFEKIVHGNKPKSESCSRFSKKKTKLFIQTQGKTFTEYMEQKYHELSKQELNVIPNSFLQTFNLKKDESMTKDSIIENQTLRSMRSSQSQSMNSNMEQLDLTQSRELFDISPTSTCSNFFQKFQTTASPKESQGRKTPQKKSFDVSFGFSNSQEEKFDIRRKDGYQIKRRKKIILNELSKDVQQQQQLIQNFETQQQMIQNLQRNKALSYSSSASFSQRALISENKFSIQKQNKTKNLQITNNIFFDIQSNKTSNLKNQIVNISEQKHEDLYNKKVPFSSRFFDNKTNFQNKMETNQHNKFILLCQYCKLSEEFVNSSNQIALCKCKGNSKLSNKYIKGSEEIGLKHVNLTIEKKKLEEDRQQNNSNIDQNNLQNQSNTHNSKSSINFLHYPFLDLQKQRLSQLPSFQFEMQSFRQSPQPFNQFEISKDNENMNNKRDENNKNISQDIQDCQEQKNIAMNEQFQRQFKKNVPIKNLPLSNQQIQGKQRKKTLIQSIYDLSPSSQKRGSMAVKSESPSSRISSRKDSINFFQRGLKDEIGGFQKQSHDGRFQLNLQNGLQNDRRRSCFSYYVGRQEGDSNTPQAAKSNTLKKILNIQREMDEYESKKLVQDGQEMDLIIKKKQNQNSNEGVQTPRSSRAGIKQRKESVTSQSKSRIFTLEMNTDRNTKQDDQTQNKDYPNQQEQTQISRTSVLKIPLNPIAEVEKDNKRFSQFFSGSPSQQGSQLQIKFKSCSPQSVMQKKQSEVYTSFAQIIKHSSQSIKNLEDTKQQNEKLSIKLSRQVPEIQKNQQYHKKDSLINTNVSLNIQTSAKSIKSHLDETNSQPFYIPSRIKGKSEYFQKSASIQLQIEEKQNNTQGFVSTKNISQDNLIQQANEKLGNEQQKSKYYDLLKNLQKKKNSAQLFNDSDQNNEVNRRKNRNQTQIISNQTSENFPVHSHKELKNNKNHNKIEVSNYDKQQEQTIQNQQQTQELQQNNKCINKISINSIDNLHYSSLLSPKTESLIHSPNQMQQSKFQFPNQTSVPSSKRNNRCSFADNNVENESDKSEYSNSSNDECEQNDITIQECQQSQFKVNSSNKQSQLKINLNNLSNSTNDQQFDLQKNKQSSERRQSIPKPPTYRQSQNLDDLLYSSFKGVDRRISVYQEVKLREIAKSNQKSIQQIASERDNIISQFIKKLQNTQQNINEENNFEDQDILQNFSSKQNNYFHNMISSLTSTVNKQDYENKKAGYILELTTKINIIFQKECIQVPMLIDCLKKYIDYCFCEMPTSRDENFLNFKIKKSTFELIINLFMFIFDENEYPIEVIAQAENYLKKNYKLICFLPSLQEEVGGSSQLNKITIKFSTILKSRFVEMFKNIESDLKETRKDQDKQIEPSSKSYKNIDNKDNKTQIIVSQSQDSNQNQDQVIKSELMMKQSQKLQKYSIIESNIESHFEQIFLKKSLHNQKNNNNNQNQLKQNQQQNSNQGNNKLVEDDPFFSSRFNSKYTQDQIEELNQQILNLFRFIYHNNSYSQLDMSSILNKQQIKQICQIFDINQNIFFEIKEILWTTLQEFNIFPQTVLRIQEQFERYRYIITQVPIVEHLCNDFQIKETIIREMELRMGSEESQMKGVFENSFTLKTFCETLIQECIYRVKSTYNLEVFFKVLKLNEMQFKYIASEFKKSCSQVGFDSSFCQDLDVKFHKLQFRINLAPSPLNLIGGYNGILKIVKVAHSMISNPQFDNEYTEYIKKFPEDLHNLLYELPPNQIIKESKYNKKPGLKFFEFFLQSLLSPEDCYSISDFRAGIQTFGIAKTTPIHWKSLIESSMHHLKYPENTVQYIMNIIQIQFLNFYQEQNDFTDMKKTVLQ